jgi:hypothetical protein
VPASGVIRLERQQHVGVIVRLPSFPVSDVFLSETFGSDEEKWS